MSFRRWSVAAWTVGAAACGCPPGDENPVPAAGVEGEAVAEAKQGHLPSWGLTPLQRVAAFEAAELARDATVEAIPSDPMERERAAWALGRIGGSRALARLLERIEAKEPAPSSAELAAVAFLEPPAGRPGEAPEPQGRWAQLEDALWTRYAVTEFGDEAAALLLAAARVGGTRSQQRLAADAVLPDGDGEPIRFVAAMEAMGMLCARGYPLDPSGLEATARGLAGPTVARGAASYVLARCAGPSAELLAGEERAGLVERLTPQLTDDDANVARIAWKALGALGEVPKEVPSDILGAAALPWQLEVEAVRALTSHADGRSVVAKRLSGMSIDALVGTRTHPVMEALRGLRKGVVGSPEFLTQLQPFATALRSARQGSKGRRRKILTLVDCELKVLEAIVAADTGPVETCAPAGSGLPSTYGEVLGVEAIVKMAKPDASLLLTRADDPRSVVAEAALAALADVDDLNVSDVLRRALQRDDPGVQAAAAGAIAARAADKSRRDEAAVAVLAQAVARLDNGKAIEARVAAIEALGSLARTSAGEGPPAWLTSAVLPLAKDPAWAVRRSARAALLGSVTLLERFDEAVPPSFPNAFDPRVARGATKKSRATGLVLATDAGEVSIAFDGAPAPIMQGVLADLVAAGYFDGLTFHRVVPAFVVQGGDPRGDGYGGPGFVVPCERSNLQYQRGSVGIALAGRDTGGSQFFIAQNREPRLDARYPIVGRVVSSMDVVDQILPYDVIQKVEVIFE